MIFTPPRTATSFLSTVFVMFLASSQVSHWDMLCWAPFSNHIFPQARPRRCSGKSTVKPAIECPTCNTEHQLWLVLARLFRYCRIGNTTICGSRLHTAVTYRTPYPPFNRKIHKLHPTAHQCDLKIVREALSAFTSWPESQGKIHMHQDPEQASNMVRQLLTMDDETAGYDTSPFKQPGLGSIHHPGFLRYSNEICPPKIFSLDLCGKTFSREGVCSKFRRYPISISYRG